MYILYVVLFARMYDLYRHIYYVMIDSSIITD